MTAIRFRVVDVFSDRPLEGNALAVVLDPVPEDAMARVAREFNLSETTFPTVTGDGAYDVRIFTPGGELPFAGHPTLGTAWVLGAGRWTQTSPGATVAVEANAGGAVMNAPTPVFRPVDGEEGMRAVGLTSLAGPAEAFDVGGMTGLCLPTDEPIDTLAVDQTAVAATAASAGTKAVAVIRALDSSILHVRVFVPGAGILEDPGTGSAAGPIGLLARRVWGTDADLVIRQGAEVGRPCRIEVHAEEGAVRVGGRVAAFAEGLLNLP